VGIILLVIGSLISRRGRMVTVGATGLGPSPQVQVYTMQADSPALRTMSGDQSGDRGDLAAKLRQLEDARNRNLISDSEYEKMRKQILDSMK
jgi:hypothetical protein